MVCLEETTTCIVFDKTPNSSQKKYTLLVRRTYTVARLISEISTQYQYPFDLILQLKQGQQVVSYFTTLFYENIQSLKKHK